jgi:hypothetical protein
MASLMRTLARSWREWSWRAAPLFGAMAFSWASMGCSSQIGSGCNLSTDCSAQGDRVCDTAQPGGYCTILNCDSFSCPDHAVCVMFESTVPGCDPLAPYSDYQQPSRSGISYCMQHCGGDGDCRSGYVCRNPRQAPWNASIISNDQSLSVCIWEPAYDAGTADAAAASADGSLCIGIQPPLASFMDAASDAVVDAPPEASDGATGADAADAQGIDAAPEDAGDAAPQDAASGGGDGGTLDGADDASIDAGAADGPTGG